MLIDKLNKEELKNLLVKNWMSHDGAWFLNSYLRLGIKKANKINKGAIRTLASLEIKRIKLLSEFKNKDISSYEELKDFINTTYSVLKGDFMDFTISFPGENRFHWDMGKCFAYEGMKRLGVEEEYECGVIYRVSCWLKELGIKHKIEPRIKNCLLNSHKQCSGDIILEF
ncbi:MAG: hypothetical protein GF317_08065 [Candidatus Lokiarchaeota archaeon]|nr:hypothetical protein [Candidatus Lokiarchaeota archaeon]MBD3199668.1 hypothetical protein [Candidatus Lokiarchaeota archaeon]